MRTSNVKGGLRICFLPKEAAEIKNLFKDSTFSLKEVGPGAFLAYPDPEGQTRLGQYGSDGHPSSLQIGAQRSAVLKKKFWGMRDVLQGKISKEGIFFKPDTTRTPLTRNRASKKKLSSKNTGVLTLTDFFNAVATVNSFVSANAGHVILQIENNKLKFLVEG